MPLTPTHKKLTTVSHCYCHTLSWTVLGGFQRRGSGGGGKEHLLREGCFPALDRMQCVPREERPAQGRAQPRSRVRVLRGWEETRCICSLVPTSEEMETQQLLPWEGPARGRQEVVGEGR